MTPLESQRLMAKNYSSSSDNKNGLRRESSREKFRELAMKYMKTTQVGTGNIRRESSYHKKLSDNMTRFYNSGK